MSDENLRRDREIELIRDKIGNGYVEQARQARAKLINPCCETIFTASEFHGIANFSKADFKNKTGFNYDRFLVSF